jgi:predicted nucleic acid-binding protein
MSPFHKPVILDNNCISNFYYANSLRSILTLWPPGTFKIPLRVYNEASNWPEHGKEVGGIIRELADNNVIEIVNINDDSDAEVNYYIQLRLVAPVLGEGESESIAIAKSREYVVATDDGLATERCKDLFPSVVVVTTADVLKMAKSDGLLKESEINQMWKLIRLKGSKR